MQQAPVFTKADNRGPNLNKRESRRKATDATESFDFDWEIPEFGLTGPTPPPSPPSGPPSCGPTPVPETPPPRTIFEPTLYEAEVEAEKYKQTVVFYFVENFFFKKVW